jgi:hypothetical protein
MAAMAQPKRYSIDFDAKRASFRNGDVPDPPRLQPGRTGSSNIPRTKEERHSESSQEDLFLNLARTDSAAGNLGDADGMAERRRVSGGLVSVSCFAQSIMSPCACSGREARDSMETARNPGPLSVVRMLLCNFGPQANSVASDRNAQPSPIRLSRRNSIPAIPHRSGEQTARREPIVQSGRRSAIEPPEARASRASCVPFAR